MTNPLAIVGAAAALIVTILLLLTGAYKLGESAERSVMREKMIMRSFELLKDRDEVNEQIKNMDDVDLCHALGGLFKDGVCK